MAFLLLVGTSVTRAICNGTGRGTRPTGTPNGAAEPRWARRNGRWRWPSRGRWWAAGPLLRRAGTEARPYDGRTSAASAARRANSPVGHQCSAASSNRSISASGSFQKGRGSEVPSLPGRRGNWLKPVGWVRQSTWSGLLSGQGRPEPSVLRAREYRNKLSNLMRRRSGGLLWDILDAR